MSQVVETHINKRGFFGWVFLILFWCFNALMALWAYFTFSVISHQYVGASGPYREAHETGTVIGGAMAGTMLLVIWALGAVILGWVALLTRGQKTVVIRS